MPLGWIMEEMGLIAEGLIECLGIVRKGGLGLRNGEDRVSARESMVAVVVAVAVVGE